MSTTIEQKLRIHTGPYDRLYLASGILWAEQPGRMVRAASKMMPPGTALDLGCGDGKNILYLENLGWKVDGIDISSIALKRAHDRFNEVNHNHKGRLIHACAVEWKSNNLKYDLIVAYGLYHCLSDSEVDIVHKKVNDALNPGGLFAVATFNNELPLPDNHCTGDIYLRNKSHTNELCSSWRCLALEHGYITETHLPLVDEHKHAMTWALFQKEKP